MQSKVIRIGTRGSALALAQAELVRARLAEAHGREAATVELVVITTSGDRVLDRALSEVGGKGLFTKEIEEALLAGTADLAVHSVKDMETALPEGLQLAGTLEREDPRDAFISARARRLAELPAGAVVGTASLRRQAQVKRLRPDLEVAVLRGNVETRLRKVAEGTVDATLLALAGLKRLGLADRAASILEPEEMLPAVGQGAIGIETRQGDQRVAALVEPILHRESGLCVAAERAFLARLDGSCRTPIAGLARIVEGELRLRGMVLSPDGARCHTVARAGPSGEAEHIGTAAAEALLAQAGPWAAAPA